MNKTSAWLLGLLALAAAGGGYWWWKKQSAPPPPPPPPPPTIAELADKVKEEKPQAETVLYKDVAKVDPETGAAQVTKETSTTDIWLEDKSDPTGRTYYLNPVVASNATWAARLQRYLSYKPTYEDLVALGPGFAAELAYTELNGYHYYELKGKDMVKKYTSSKYPMNNIDSATYAWLKKWTDGLWNTSKLDGYAAKSSYLATLLLTAPSPHKWIQSPGPTYRIT